MTGMRQRYSAKEYRQLAIGIRQSDTDSYARLYDATAKHLVQFGFSIVSDEQTAYDLMHDAFERLWKMRKTIDENRSVVGLLFTMVKNDAIKQVSRRKQTVDAAEVPDLSGSSSVESEQDAALLGALFSKWIEDLPHRQFEVFTLSRNSELSHAEIAAILGISKKTVNNHLVAALRTLRQKMNYINKV